MVRKVCEKVCCASANAKTALAVGGVSVLSCATPLVAHASEAGGGMDITGVISMVQAVMVLLTTEPLNYFLMGGLALMAFKVFSGGKKAANA